MLERLKCGGDDDVEYSALVTNVYRIKVSMS